MTKQLKAISSPAKMEENFVPGKIFFDGKIYEAIPLLQLMVVMASRRILLVDETIDENVLNLLECCNQSIRPIVMVRKFSQEHSEIVSNFNGTHPIQIPVGLSNMRNCTYLVIDDKLFHISTPIYQVNSKPSVMMEIHPPVSELIIANL